jgi:hypothetical protein
MSLKSHLILIKLLSFWLFDWPLSPAFSCSELPCGSTEEHGSLLLVRKPLLVFGRRDPKKNLEHDACCSSYRYFIPLLIFCNEWRSEECAKLWEAICFVFQISCEKFGIMNQFQNILRTSTIHIQKYSPPFTNRPLGALPKYPSRANGSLAGSQTSHNSERQNGRNNIWYLDSCQHVVT